VNLVFKSSLRNRLIVFLLAATLLPIGTSIGITYWYSKESVAKESINANSNLLRQGSTNLINYLNAFQQNSLIVYNNTELFNILNYVYYQTNEYSQGGIEGGMRSISHSMKEIYQVYLHLSKSNRSYLMTQDQLNKKSDPNSDYIPLPAPSEVYVDPPHDIHPYGMGIILSSQKVLSFRRNIVNAVNGEQLGLLTVDFTPDMLRTICGQLYDSGAEELYIVDGKGRIIYSPDAGQDGHLLSESWLRHMLSLPQESGHFSWNSDDFSGIAVYERMNAPYLDWTIVKKIPNGHLYANARQLTTINTLVISLFLIIAVAATIYISLRLTSPIKRLIGYMNRIETGKLDVDIQVEGGTDELAILGKRFRTMMGTINNLIDREYKLELANRTNELKALQAQINPHFLNNALQSIGTLALQHEERQIYSLISSLGKMMRYSMHTEETAVPLSAEIDYLKAYLDLQKQRFEDDLICRFDIDPASLSVFIPKMTLQPIVENAFKHALDLTNGTKEIVIACKMESDSELVVEVTNNGPGLSREKLHALNALLNDSDSRQKGGDLGIGLSNVLARLKLYCGDKASIILTDGNPQGLKVTVRIPVQKGEAS
jgi:two-component system sensor histidine kinase YesM